MTAMKKTLLQIVQDIQDSMDSEQVNSLSDSLEATQIAEVVESVFYDIIANRLVPETKRLLKLTSLSDNSFPTYFLYPSNVNGVESVWYDISDSGETTEYRMIEWCNPHVFLSRLDYRSDNIDEVSDKVSGVTLLIHNDRQPRYYTSFDDEHIIMDSYDSSKESILQESKTRAFGTLYPSFQRSDNYTPEVNENIFPYLIAESRARAFEYFKGGVPTKVEKNARRSKVWLLDDKFRTVRENKRNRYGR